MISVVIPIFNESQLIKKLMLEVLENLRQLTNDFEVIGVNDGSTDLTLEILLELRKSEPKIKVVNLSRNFGLQAALTAGLEVAKGDKIVIMDGDFQDPPKLIPVLIQKLKESNADIVSALRNKRAEKFSRRIITSVFYKIFSSISDEQQIGNAGNFCVLNKKALTAILSFAEKNRYLPGIRNIVGFKQEYISYDRAERLEGKPKMKREKLVTLAADAIYSFSKWPVKICLYTGLAGIVIFLLAIVYTLVSKFTGFAPLGWSSMFLAVSFFGSVQLTFLGIIGEYVYRIYKEVQNRPIYFVKDFYE